MSVNDYYSLDGYGLLRVQGADAFEFLNAQICSDLSVVSPTASSLSGYCNPKGRLLACMRIFQTGDASDAYYLRMPESILADVARRLTMFVMRAQVEISVCDDDDFAPYVGFIANADDMQNIASPPPKVNGCAPLNAASTTGVILRVPSHDRTPRFEIYCTRSAREQLNLAATNARDFTAWRRADILAGLPTVYPETAGLFVPQMANLDLVDALSYTKGCYPGQEVVARMHYLGKIKRRMVKFASAQSPAPGDDVFVPSFSADQAAGAVADAVPDDNGGCVGLAVVRLQGLGDQAMRLGAIDGPSAEMQPLPYAINETTADPNDEDKT